LFKVVERKPRPAEDVRNQVFLEVDYWDDWGKYRTMFTLHVADANGNMHTIGSVKIGQRGLRPASKVSENHRAPALQEEFEALSEDFFSLGQDEDYYESLNQLSSYLRESILNGLRDCAANLALFEAVENEEVMRESLLRHVRLSSVYGRLNRLTRGDARQTRYTFVYGFPPVEGEPPVEMSFDVTPESLPPTNVHVLIGRNGVGKTQCMRSLALSLLGRQAAGEQSPGSILMVTDEVDSGEFSGLVLVSFSAFDDFDLRPQKSDTMPCHQVGLRSSPESEAQAVSKGLEELSKEFADSLYRCSSGVKAERWRSAIAALEDGDDLFEEADATSLLEEAAEETFAQVNPEHSDSFWKRRARHLFKRLSSGHAIVLLTVTRLVELVDERTLVLLDEPEGHLHPPLLASFIRCLSDLLVRRNGVAIIATHSPVVLQEVPRQCAWKLRRSRAVSVVERPTIQTFGENIGVLTREVFGLQVTQSGFHRLLSDAVGNDLDYESIVSRFRGQLGDDAKAILRALVVERGRQANA